MAQTDLDVVNQAIGKLGADQIDEISEDTPIGAFASTNYASRRAYCLSLYRWVFASVLRPLQATPAPADAPYPYAYLTPPDVAGSIYAYRKEPHPRGPEANQIIPLQIDGLIFSHVTPLYAEYTRQVPENQWPAWFTEFVATAFAADVAGFLQRNAQQAQFDTLAFGDPRQFPERNGGLYLAATVQDSKNAPQRQLEPVWGGPLVAVRPVYGGFIGPFGLSEGFDFVEPDGTITAGPC
jgi:hypothetical protein